MKIINVFNQKGGCGKTTLAIHLSGGLAAEGYRVLLIDLDKQHTATKWSLRRGFNADSVSLARNPERLLEHLATIENKYDVVVIDCPPAIDSEAPWYALSVADLALIPVVPDMVNMEATQEAMDLALQACAGVELPGGIVIEGNEELEARLVVNRMESNVVLHKKLYKQIQGSIKVRPMVTSLQKRAAYAAGQVSGLTVLTAKRGDPEAKKEFGELLAEVESLLELTPVQEAA